MDSEQGLIYNITGNGKGKSSSAFGMAIRFLGWGSKIAIIQFVKSDGMQTGEKQFFHKFFPETTFVSLGLGFTCTAGDHQGYAQATWEYAKRYIAEFEGDLIILDELNIALHHKYIDIDDVVNTLKSRRKNLNIIITGRYIRDEIKDISDLVSEVVNHKHPFEKGITARKGLDF